MPLRAVGLIAWPIGNDVETAAVHYPEAFSCTSAGRTVLNLHGERQ